MIQATYYRKYNRMTVTGHAGSAESGRDLVCASASMLAYTLAANVANMADNGQVREPIMKMDEGNTEISCKPRHNLKASVTLVFDSVCVGFELLAHDYVYTQTEVMDYRKFKELRAQGRSAKYTLTSPGWKRVLNIIRATNGTLQLGIAKATGGIYAVQALGINFTGNVNFPSVGIDTEPVIYQVYDHEFGDNNADDTARHARITQVRIGYPASNTEYPESDGSVNYKTNPINCYVDVYVDFNADSGNAQLNMNFSGFADSHNCTSITKETNAQDTGMYGETLQYKTFDVSRESTIYMPDGSITAKKVHAGNMPYELLESTNENPVILRNLPNGIYYISGNGYYCEGKAAAFTKGLYIVKRLSSQSDIVRLCPENTTVRFYTITDNSYTNTPIDISKIASNSEKIAEMADGVEINRNDIDSLSALVATDGKRIDGLIADAIHPEVKTDDMTQPVGVDENGALWTTPGGASVENIQPIYSMEVTDEAGVAGIKIPFADYDENGKITKVHKYKDLVAVITVPGGSVTTAVGLDIRYFTRMQYNGNLLSDTSFADLSYSHATRVPSGLRVYSISLRTSVEWIGIDKGTLPKTIFHDSDHRWTSTNWYPARVLAKDGDIYDYCRGIWILSASADKQTIPVGTKILVFGNEI